MKQWLMKIAAILGFALLLPMTAPAVTTQTATSLPVIEQANYDYDAGSVHVTSDDTMTCSAAAERSVPAFGQSSGLDAAKTTLKDVSKAYFKEGKLPDNFITKENAKALGWDPAKGNLAEVAPGKSIGGDIFSNRPVKGVRPLPDAPGRVWYEADLNYQGGYRGSERLIYSNDGLIYYSGDHYKTFQMLGARQ